MRKKQEDIIANFIKIHKNKYDYSKVNYKKFNQKIIIICLLHGEFLQTPQCHKKGQGCPACGNIKKSKNKIFVTKEVFIERASKTHNNLYNYSDIKFVRMNQMINNIKCFVHGYFSQIGYDHCFGRGCNKCAIKLRAKNISYNTEKFIELAQKIHKNKFNYNEVNYESFHKKVKIICYSHGEFYQKPAYHLSGSECPVCAKSGVSKLETNWLDELKISRKNRQFIIMINNKKIIVDGFDPLTNTVYEFYGDFFHGNPNLYNSSKINSVNHVKFGDLYSKTMQREKILLDAGYRLITKWETPL